MPEVALAAALLAGLLGSAHCAVMCGGIATALGAVPAGRARSGRLALYHAGRIGSYAAAGALAGAAGAAVGLAFAFSRWGEILRLATATIVVLIGLDIALGGGRRARWLRLPERAGARLWRLIAPLAHTPLFQAGGATRALMLGLLWGWLPCGLVYSVLLAASVTGGAAGGALTMAAFGLGTLPAMAGLSFLGSRLPGPHSSLARLLGAVLVACGLWTAIVPIAVLSGSQLHQHHQTSAPVRNPSPNG
ncbi:MAG TPA: sulfite exporter TauE/SafE family protein [Steroidobacteraceae bacterium]|nr:sulfite exporter TauE/SafE family protein [Steroidobacteraceae bacterium]